MKSKLITILLSGAMLVSSCDGRFQLINCPDCSMEEPATAAVEIRLEENSKFSTTVNVYEGKIEDNILLSTYHPVSSFEVTLSVNKVYTFEAIYSGYGGKVYIAIDSAFPRVKLDKQQCESWCYYVYDRKVNLALKYE